MERGKGGTELGPRESGCETDCGLGAMHDWVRSFVASRDLSTDKLVNNFKGVLDGIGGKLQWVSAFLDLTTNYYEHTGTQTVARSLINRAVGEV